MADINLGTVFTSLGGPQFKPAVVWVGPDRGFWLYLTSSTVTYRRTVDSGVTWLTAIDIVTGIAAVSIIAIWADWWTPGDAGRSVHIIFEDAGTVKYVNFDALSETSTSPVTVQAGIGGGSMNGAIAKMRGGDLVVLLKESTDEFGKRSKDGGGTWADITVPFAHATASGNNILVVPGNEVNKNDAWAIELSNGGAETPQFHVFDSTTDVWTTTALPGFTSATSNYMDGIINPANNHLLLAFSHNNNSSSPVSFWDINGSSSLMRLADIRGNSHGLGAVSLAVREDTGRIYALYPIHDGDNATFADPAVIKWRFSDDGGLTWAQEDTWNEDPGGKAGVEGIWAGGPIPKLQGGRIQPVWVDTGGSGSNEAHTNQVVSIEVAAVTATPDPLEDCPTPDNEVFVDSALTCACQKEDTFIIGLEHLEGEEVAITVDNATRPNKTILNGRISFPKGIVPGGTGDTTVQVGLAYASELETLPLETQTRAGLSVGKLKHVERARVRIHNGRGGTAAIKTSEKTFTAEPVIPRKVKDPTSAAPPLFSGIVDLGMEGSGDPDVRIVIRQDDPQPLTVLAITTELDVDDV